MSENKAEQAAEKPDVAGNEWTDEPRGEVRVRLSTEFRKRAARDRLLHVLLTRSIPRYAVGFGLMAVGFISMGGPPEWSLGFVAALLLVAVAVWIVAFVRISKLKDRKEPLEVVYRFFDDGLEVMTDDGWARTKWDEFRSLLVTHKAWLLFVSRNAYFAIPPSELTEELANFITGQMTARKKPIRRFGFGLSRGRQG